MNSLSDRLTDRVVEALRDRYALERLPTESDWDSDEPCLYLKIRNAITTPPKANLGDLAVPCFVLAKELKTSPVHIALELSDAFACDELFVAAAAMGPYLNVTVDGSILAEDIIEEILEQGADYGGSVIAEPPAVVVDYSSPNIAKPLGVHHLRSTMIGNAICSLYEKRGYRVERVNYLGDWGTQFGKLITAYSMSSLTGNSTTIENLAYIYAEFCKMAKEDSSLDDKAREWFKRLEDGDKIAVDLWKQFNLASLAEFKEIYQRLGVSFTQFDGESNYSQAALDVVKEAQEKGIAEVGDGGAIVVPMEGKDPPCMLAKSDGATTYMARDVAAVIQRYKDHKFEKMLYVVGEAQALHFKQVFHVVKQLGYDFADKCHHVPFGLLKFGGAKCSTRKGNMLLLNDVLDTAADEVAGLVKEKNNQIDEKTIDQIGVGAVVFADLSRKRINDANFKWEEILNFDGSTGPYLQYTTARCFSILDKAAMDLSQDMRTFEDKNYLKGLKQLKAIEEKRLLLKLQNFGSVLNLATQEFEPSILAQYALGLAKLINKFIHNCRVIQKDKTLELARCTLVHCCHLVLSESLRILGIKPLEKM